jgi:hypothetical protein
MIKGVTQRRGPFFVPRSATFTFEILIPCRYAVVKFWIRK